jgi:hypothetical protein
MGMAELAENEELQLLSEHRELFERLAQSDLPISEDATRALSHLESAGDRDD